MGNGERILCDGKKYTLKEYRDLKESWEKILKKGGCYTRKEERDLQKKQIPSSSSILDSCVSIGMKINESGDSDYKISPIEARDHENIHKVKLYKTPANDSTLARIMLYSNRFWKCFSATGTLQNEAKAKSINKILFALHKGPIRSVIENNKVHYNQTHGKFCHSQNGDVQHFLKIAGIRKWQFLSYHTSFSISGRESKSKKRKINAVKILKDLSPLQRNVMSGMMNGKRIEEMAQEYNCSQQNISKALSRAIKNSRKNQKHREEMAHKRVVELKNGCFFSL